MCTRALKWLRDEQKVLLLDTCRLPQVEEYFCPEHGDVVHATLGPVHKQYGTGAVDGWLVCPEHGMQTVERLPTLPAGYVVIGKEIKFQPELI